MTVDIDEVMKKKTAAVRVSELHQETVSIVLFFPFLSSIQSDCTECTFKTKKGKPSSACMCAHPDH